MNRDIMSGYQIMQIDRKTPDIILSMGLVKGHTGNQAEADS